MDDLSIALPMGMDLEGLDFDGNVKNVSVLLSANFDDDVRAQADPAYEQFLADLWVGIVLTLMVLSCVCCMCSCLLYHKFQQWKRNVLESRNSISTIETGNQESESLPSYTIVSGLPSYEEALEQLKKVKELNDNTKGAEASQDTWVPRTPPTPVATLSAKELFQLYKSSGGSQPPQISSSKGA